MCVTITKGGKAITENRMYEKKRHTRGTIRMCALMHIKN